MWLNRCIAAELPQNCRRVATARIRQEYGKNMQTIETSTYTCLELFWELERYRHEFVSKPFSERTFRLWRQKLEIVSDPRTGLYWGSDLEILKDATRRVSQGQTLDQIREMRKKREREYADYQ